MKHTHAPTHGLITWQNCGTSDRIDWGDWENWIDMGDCHESADVGDKQGHGGLDG